MLQLRSILTLTIGLLLAASLPAAAQPVSLDSLPLATQDEITQVCLPVQFRDGAGAYRECVQSELALRTSGGGAVFEQLSFDDKYAVQQACSNTGGQSSQNYKACVATQISELNQIAAPSLNDLSEDELYVVQQSCFNAQSTQGAAKYRQCLNAELESLSGIPAADTSGLSMLNKNALQLRCSSTATNAVQYRKCVADQFESIAGTKPSFLPTFPAVEIIGQAGATSGESVAEPVAESVANESDSSTAELQPNPTPIENPTPELAAAQIVDQPPSTDIAAPGNEPTSTDPASTDPVIILPSNSNDAALPADSTAANQPAAATQAEVGQNTATQTSLADASNDTFGSNTLPQTTIDNANTNAQSVSLTEEARVISRPDLVDTLEAQDQLNVQAVEADPAAGTDSSTALDASAENATPMQKLNALWLKIQSSLSSMDSIGWLLIAGVLALPALLLGFFTLLRGLRRSPPAGAAAGYRAPLHDNHFDAPQPELDSRRLRHEQDAATLFDDEIVPDHHDAVTRIATKSEQQQASRGPYITAAQEPTPSSNDQQSAFSGWLLQQPEANRMEACVEFLIYWVAYGDDRYQPDLKQRLFTDTQLSSHDQIKRWVLKQDVFAFADVVGWLSTNATQKQLDQCVALLMALLVTEHSITPVQNTVLRFLSDAFNIGKFQLEQRFEKAFGHPMPPVPRTDKEAWWTKQQPELMQRWEARFMSTRAENEQMIARLGLSADYDEAQVINAFRRAARRCHPDRFTELGDRERALAEQQFIKFEQARDKLLGVSV